jgi:hypothetical protein
MLEGNRGHRSITNKALDELHVKAKNCLTIGFAISLASQFAAVAMEDVGKPADPHHRRYFHHRIPPDRGSVETTAVAPGVPSVAKPAASLPVQNDSDGLSRDPEDCNKGCLDSSD